MSCSCSSALSQIIRDIELLQQAIGSQVPTQTSLNNFSTIITNQYNTLNNTVLGLQTTVNLLQSQVNNFFEGKTYVNSEIPAGAINGINTVFTLANIPDPATSVHWYVDSLRVTPSGNYTVLQNNVIVNTAYPSGTTLLADYIY